MAPEPTRETRRTPAAVAAIAGVLVLGAATVWGALEVAAVLALEGATTAGAAYAVVRARRRLHRRTGRHARAPSRAIPG